MNRRPGSEEERRNLKKIVLQKKEVIWERLGEFQALEKGGSFSSRGPEKYKIHL